MGAVGYAVQLARGLFCCCWALWRTVVGMGLQVMLHLQYTKRCQVLSEDPSSS